MLGKYERLYIYDCIDALIKLIHKAKVKLFIGSNEERKVIILANYIRHLELIRV